MATDRYTVIVDTKSAQTNLGALKTSLGGIGAAVGAAFAVDSVIQFGQTVINTANDFKVMQNQLKLITNDQNELNDAMKALQGISQATFTDLGGTVELYSKLKLATEGIGASTDEVLQVTKNFQQALALSGADANTAAGAIKQFGQAMASGQVRGDEFTSIVEALGPALNIMARESGLTVDELREMSREGELTAEAFFDMIKNADSLNEAFKSLTPTTEQLKTNLQNTFDEVVIKIDEAIGASDLFDEALIKLNQGLAGFFNTSASLKDLSAENIFEKFETGALSAKEAIIALGQKREEVAGFFFPGLGFSNQEEVDAITAQIDAINETIKAGEEAKRVADEHRAAQAKILEPLSAMNTELDAINQAYQKNIPKSQKLRTEYDKTKETLDKLLALRKEEVAKTPEYQQALDVTKNRLAQLKGELDGTAKSTKEASKEMTRLTENTERVIDSLKDKTSEMQFEFDKLNMDPLQREIADIERDIDTRIRKQIEELEARMTPENAAKITAQISALKNAASEAISEQSRLATESYEHQRSFAYGWNQAFQQYKNDATNAANAARDIFQQSTSAINSAIDNFVETGKFSLKGLLEDIAKTAAKTVLKTGVNNLISGIMGNVMAGPVQGPQQPNRGGIGGFFDNLLGDVFGGFFANGGYIPAGKFGIVGERGPEMVTGPANVTPGVGGGGAMNVTIHAVDATSFKQMVARDPAFIYAVAQRGSRSFR